jgi:hypothetical protein
MPCELYPAYSLVGFAILSASEPPLFHLAYKNAKIIFDHLSMSLNSFSRTIIIKWIFIPYFLVIVQLVKVGSTYVLVEGKSLWSLMPWFGTISTFKGCFNTTF